MFQLSNNLKQIKEELKVLAASFMARYVDDNVPFYKMSIGTTFVPEQYCYILGDRDAVGQKLKKWLDGEEPLYVFTEKYTDIDNLVHLTKPTIIAKETGLTKIALLYDLDYVHRIHSLKR